MSKINLLFVITFVSRNIETCHQCHSVKGDSGNLSQPSISLSDSKNIYITEQMLCYKSDIQISHVFSSLDITCSQNVPLSV